MNSIHEFSLLIAVSLPVLAIVGLNIFLAFTGERNTLLFPGSMKFAPVDFGGEVQVVREEGARQIDTTMQASANDELIRQAA
jgi:hypothetical protein